MISQGRTVASPGRPPAGSGGNLRLLPGPPILNGTSERLVGGFRSSGTPSGRQPSNADGIRSPSAADRRSSAVSGMGRASPVHDRSRLPLRTLQTAFGQYLSSSSGAPTGNGFRRSPTLASASGAKVVNGAIGMSLLVGPSPFSKPSPQSGGSPLYQSSSRDSGGLSPSGGISRGRGGSRTALVDPHSSTRHIARSVPSLLDSVDSVHFLRHQQPAGEQTTGQQALLALKNQINPPTPATAVSVSTGSATPPAITTSSRPCGPTSETSSYVATGAATSPEAAADIRMAEGQAAAAAAVRLAVSNRKQRYSEGDRIAYQADRVDFQAHRSGVAYYALCAVSSGDNLMFHGGQYTAGGTLDGDNATGDLFRWNSASGCQRVANINGPLPKLGGHSMVCYKGSRLFMYGGCGPQTTGLFSDLWVVNLRGAICNAVATSTPQPPGRARHACAVHNNMMYVHGGHCHRSGAKLLSDMWVLNMESATWTKLPVDVINLGSLTTEEVDDNLSNGPGGRYGHHMAIWHGWLYIAFGSDGGHGFTDMWAYNLEHQYWNKVVPEGRQPEVRIDCASAKFHNKWLFHGGLDGSGNFLNCFYEFNFDTHEGRQLRVELAVTPIKILPALVGHAMTNVNTASQETGAPEERVLIFGGINRQRTVVHVIYSVKDTGRSPGTVTRPVRWPDRMSKVISPPLSPPSISAVSSLPLPEVSKRPTSPAAWLRRDLSGSVSENEGGDRTREHEPDLVSISLTSATAAIKHAEQQELRRQLQAAALAEVEELRRENEQLRARLASLSLNNGGFFRGNASHLGLLRGRLPPKDAMLELMAKTEEAFATVRQLGEAWSQLYRTLDLS